MHSLAECDTVQVLTAILFGLAMGGGVALWRGLTNRGGPTVPEGIPEGTPWRDWPKEDQKDRHDYLAASRWKLFVVGGVVALIVGAVGWAITVVDEISSAGKPSRAEVIDSIASDPDNGFDRAEATCVFDMFEDLGIDTFDMSRDEFLQRFVAASAEMSDAELARMDSCFDEESKLNRGASLTDAEVRQFFIDFLTADPATGIDRETAECMVNFLEDRDLLREALVSGTTPTAELEAAFLEVDLACAS